MDNFECLKIVGEGSYGVVMKCQCKNTGQIVAIKKFQETSDKSFIEKIALRELHMLKKLRHENIIKLIDAFKENKYFHFVFEFMDGTLLNELEKHSGGLGLTKSRDIIFQVLKALQFCHQNYVLHRDMKPENILISKTGLVKICDFGFARYISPFKNNTIGDIDNILTEYVATRWYRAPELLICDPDYKFEIDIWAVGCIFAETMTGTPLFPGDSDIDQLHLIIRLNGSLCTRHKHILAESQVETMHVISDQKTSSKLDKCFDNWPKSAINFLELCLQMDPNLRPNADKLLCHEMFRSENYWQKNKTDVSFMKKLQIRIKNKSNISHLRLFNFNETLTKMDSPQRPISSIKLPNSNNDTTKKFEVHLPQMISRSFFKPVFQQKHNDFSMVPIDKNYDRKNIPEWLKQLETNSKRLEKQRLFDNFDLPILH